jgi:site-specific recombinase XerD
LPGYATAASSIENDYFRPTGVSNSWRLHDLRHPAASLMLTVRVNPRVMMEILGHSQINITMNTYTHVSTATVQAEVQRSLMGDLALSMS